MLLDRIAQHDGKPVYNIEIYHRGLPRIPHKSLFHRLQSHWYLYWGSSPPTFGADGLDEPGTCVDRVDRSALVTAFVALHV